jgi:hypothetical protein
MAVCVLAIAMYEIALAGSLGQVVVSGRAGPTGSTFITSEPPDRDQIEIGTGTAAITGVVVDGTSGKPIPGAIVSISGPSATPGGTSLRGVRQIADDRGRFAFTGLPGGIGYLLAASKFGYFDGRYGSRGARTVSRRITLVDGQWFADATIEMERPASIGGRVLDDAGEPVVGVPVRAFTEIFVAGTRHLAAGVVAETDDRGIYRLANLAPGRYLVMVPSVQHAVPASTSALELSGTTAEAVAAAESFGRESPIRRYPALPVDPSHRLVLAGYPPPPLPAADGTPRVYPSTWYPSARTLSNTTAIEVGAGDDRQNVDIQLQPVRGFRVSGRLDGPPEAVAGITLRLMPTGAEALGEGTEAATALAADDGTFTFLNVPAGAYTVIAARSVSEYRFAAPLSASTPLPRIPGLRSSGMSSSAVMSAPAGTSFSTTRSTGSQRYQGRLAVNVGDADVSDVVVPLLGGATVTGTIVLEHRKAPPPELLRIISIRAEPANGDPSLGQPRSQRQPDDPLAFTIEGVLPGTYLIRPFGPGGLVKSITWNGKDYTYTPIDLTSGGDAAGVVVTLTDEGGTVSGVVRDASGQPAADAAVIHFPVEPSQWSNFGLQPTKLRATTASTTGAYALRQLPAGDYYVIAVDGEQIDAWKDPAFLERAARGATRVSVDWGATNTQDLVIQLIR